VVSGRSPPRHRGARPAHIHEAAAGKNGRVIDSLTKAGDTYDVPRLQAHRLPKSCQSEIGGQSLRERANRRQIRAAENAARIETHELQRFPDSLGSRRKRRQPPSQQERKKKKKQDGHWFISKTWPLTFAAAPYSRKCVGAGAFGNTVGINYGSTPKYVDTLNTLIAGTDMTKMTLWNRSSLRQPGRPGQGRDFHPTTLRRPGITRSLMARPETQGGGAAACALTAKDSKPRSATGGLQRRNMATAATTQFAAAGLALCGG